MLKKIFRKQVCTTDVVSPITGKVIPIEDVNDPTFANKLMGDGIAIEPSTNTIVAPCHSKVIMISDTKHAIGLETTDGMQIILHIGIDTVKRNGRGFELVCEEGDVKTGDPLVVFDRESMEDEGVDTTVLVVFVDTKEFQVKNVMKTGLVVEGESIVTQLVKEKV